MVQRRAPRHLRTPLRGGMLGPALARSAFPWCWEEAHRSGARVPCVRLCPRPAGNANRLASLHEVRDVDGEAAIPVDMFTEAEPSPPPPPQSATPQPEEPIPVATPAPKPPRRDAGAPRDAGASDAPHVDASPDGSTGCPMRLPTSRPSPRTAPTRALAIRRRSWCCRRRSGGQGSRHGSHQY